MANRTCRAPDHCQLPAASNGYFCHNHWKMVDLNVRGQLLAYPPKPGPPSEGRNVALHKALFELRTKLNIREPIVEIEVGTGEPA